MHLGNLASVGACVLALAVTAFGAEPPKKAIDPKTVLSDSVAAWHFGDLSSADNKSPLAIKGDIQLGIPLTGDALKASLARGGDGRVAVVKNGHLDAGQGANSCLNLKGNAMSLLLRFRNPTGEWGRGELLCKHGGHDKLVYNLYVLNDNIAFEYGFDGRAGLAGHVATASSVLKPKQWHDLIIRYDGQWMSMFIDGVRVARTAATGSFRQGNIAPVQIGTSRAFKGEFDHAALWSRALTDDEIVALSGGPAEMARRQEAYAKEVEAKIGKEGLTLTDQLRGARELRMKLWSDPHRPRYHLLPPDGSWNDINGTIYWKGRYHVFFLGRLAPDRDTILSGKDTLHAREIWLHSSSRDLVHWIHHPPALTPVFDGSMPRGLYSGGAVAGAPVPTIIVHVPGQGTCIATAEDDELIRWKLHPANPVIPMPRQPVEYIVFDPCAWKEGDIYYALVGNKNKRPGYEGDTTSLFRSPDLVKWDYVGPFYKSDRKWTTEIEDCACPDFFPIGNGKHMLIMHVHRPYGHSQYYIGRYEKEQFYPEIHGKFAWPGGQLMAPETLLDGKNRRVYWGWIGEARGGSNGWASVATLPRIFSLFPDNTLRIDPAPELEVLRHNPRQKTNLTIADGQELVLDNVRGDCLEMNLLIDPANAREFGLKVRCAPDGAEQTPIVCIPQESTLKIDLAKSTLDPAVKYARRPGKENQPAEQVAPFALKPGEPLRLRIFLDRSILEVFANDRLCITQRIYPSRPDSQGISLFSRGGAMKVKSLEAWDMSPTNSW